MQKLKHRSIHIGNALNRGLILTVKYYIFLYRNHTGSPFLRPVISRSSPDMIVFSLMGKVKIHITFHLRLCILAPEIFTVPVRSACASV